MPPEARRSACASCSSARFGVCGIKPVAPSLGPIRAFPDPSSVGHGRVGSGVGRCRARSISRFILVVSMSGHGRAVPDYSTLCRRQKTMVVQLPHRGSGGPLHLAVDGTGIKVRGEGEWHARKHGGAMGDSGMTPALRASTSMRPHRSSAVWPPGRVRPNDRDSRQKLHARPNVLVPRRSVLIAAKN